MPTRVFLELVREGGRRASLLVSIELPTTSSLARRELTLCTRRWPSVAVEVLDEHWLDAMPFGRLAARIPAAFVATRIAARRGRRGVRLVAKFSSEHGAAESDEVELDVGAHALRAASKLPIPRESRTRAALVGLADGTLLLAGGRLGPATGIVSASTELLAPRGRAWKRAGALGKARALATLTLLRDGTVLCSGGVEASGATALDLERFDPKARRWTPAGRLASAFARHAVLELPDGRVALLGDGGTAEIWEPARGRVHAVASLAARQNPLLAPLGGGRVLVAGDAGPRAPADSIWEPRTGSVREVGVAVRRSGHTLTATGEREVLVCGGVEKKRLVAAALSWDPVAGTVRPAGALEQPRRGHRAVPLGNGNVVIVGGTTESEQLLRASSFRADSFDTVVPVFGVARLVEAWSAGPIGGAFQTCHELEWSLDELAIASFRRASLALVGCVSAAAVEPLDDP